MVSEMVQNALNNWLFELNTLSTADVSQAELIENTLKLLEMEGMPAYILNIHRYIGEVWMELLNTINSDEYERRTAIKIALKLVNYVDSEQIVNIIENL